MVKNETLVSYFHPLHCLYSSFKHSLILIPYSFTTVSLILILDLHLPYPPPRADPCRLKMRHSKIRNSLFFFNPFTVIVFAESEANWRKDVEGFTSRMLNFIKHAFSSSDATTSMISISNIPPNVIFLRRKRFF